MKTDLLFGLVLLAHVAGCAKTSHPAGESSNAGSSAQGDGHAIPGAGAAGSPGHAGTAGSVEAGTNGGTSGAAAGAGSEVAGAAGAQEPQMPELGECGLPWYQCYEECIQMKLRGGGRQTAECDGRCDPMLSLSPTIGLESAVCAGISAQLVVPGPDGTQQVITARLTEAAWEQLMQISRALADVMLSPASGCTDCAPYSWIDLSDGQGGTQSFHYLQGAPRPELAEADAFVQRLIDQLIACEGDLIEGQDCSHIGGPCRLRYTNTLSGNERTCDVGEGDPAPCATALRCLCSGAVLPSSGMDIESCVDSWLTLRDAITFSDFCVESGTPALNTLAEALDGFASTHQAQVETSEACTRIDAFY